MREWSYQLAPFDLVEEEEEKEEGSVGGDGVVDALTLGAKAHKAGYLNKAGKNLLKKWPERFFFFFFFFFIFFLFLFFFPFSLPPPPPPPPLSLTLPPPPSPQIRYSHTRPNFLLQNSLRPHPLGANRCEFCVCQIEYIR